MTPDISTPAGTDSTQPAAQPAAQPARPARPAQPVYRRLATAIAARLNCAESGNTEWFDRWTDTIAQITRDYLPHGSGVDSGCTVDLDRSTADRIVIHTSFHHMDEGGGYAGWTDHTITVRGSLLSAFDITIGGRNRNDIKEYLADLFSGALSELVKE